MKTTIVRAGALMGTGAGLALFGLFVLFPGNLPVSALATDIREIVNAIPFQSALLFRMMVLASMLSGIVVSGIVIVAASCVFVRLAGNAASCIEHRHPAPSATEITQKNKTVKRGIAYGTTVGAFVFAVSGFLGFFLGSYGSLILFQKMMAGTAGPEPLMRAAAITGIVVGTSYAAAVSLIAGGPQRAGYILWEKGSVFFALIVAKIRNCAMMAG